MEIKTSDQKYWQVSYTLYEKTEYLTETNYIYDLDLRGENGDLLSFEVHLTYPLTNRNLIYAVAKALNNLSIDLIKNCKEK